MGDIEREVGEESALSLRRKKESIEGWNCRLRACAERAIVVVMVLVLIQQIPGGSMLCLRRSRTVYANRQGR